MLGTATGYMSCCWAGALKKIKKIKETGGCKM